MFECSEFAKETGRKFELKWFPEGCCGVLFGDLFEYTDLIPESNFNLDFKNIRESSCELQLSYSNNTLYAQRGCERRVQLLQQRLGRLSGDWRNLVVVSGGGMSLELSKEEFAKRKQHFYSSFVIKKDILSNINELKDKYFQKNVLGVHIRAGDKLSNNGYKKTVEAMCRNSLKHISPIVDNYDHVYLASDEMMVYDFLSKKIDNLIYQPEPDNSRRTKEGMAKALIDWYLLGECDLLLACPGSTFSEESALRKSTKTLWMKGLYKE